MAEKSAFFSGDCKSQVHFPSDRTMWQGPNVGTLRIQRDFGRQLGDPINAEQTRAAGNWWGGGES